LKKQKLFNQIVFFSF